MGCYRIVFLLVNKKSYAFYMNPCSIYSENDYFCAISLPIILNYLFMLYIIYQSCFVSFMASVLLLHFVGSLSNSLLFVLLSIHFTPFLSFFSLFSSVFRLYASLSLYWFFFPSALPLLFFYFRALSSSFFRISIFLLFSYFILSLLRSPLISSFFLVFLFPCLLHYSWCNHNILYVDTRLLWNSVSKYI